MPCPARPLASASPAPPPSSTPLRSRRWTAGLVLPARFAAGLVAVYLAGRPVRLVRIAIAVGPVAVDPVGLVAADPAGRCARAAPSSAAVVRPRDAASPVASAVVTIAGSF